MGDTLYITMTLPVSVVIPTYNRAALLARMLPTYLKQDCREIVVVDDCSVPPVQEFLPSGQLLGASSTRVRVIRNSRRRQQPVSRMEGVRACREPYVFFGEDDVALAEGHIPTLFRALQMSGADGVASYCLLTTRFDPDPGSLQNLPRSNSWKDFVNLADVTFRTTHRIDFPLPVPWLHTWALLRRDVILKYGFDPNYRGNAFREETDFYLRASHQGAKFLLVDAPPVFHYKGSFNGSGGQHGGSGLMSFFWYEYWVARNNHYFLTKNADALRALGHNTNPLFETLRYCLRRGLGYPGRLRFELQRRLRG
jgi:glycosyltransferase involved in cell wall biosynthesis